MKAGDKGFVPVMLTPFTETGKIDLKGLSLLTELYVKAGASGLFSNCLSSEMFELSPDERLQIVKHVADVVSGTVRVVAAGTFGGNIGEQAEFVKRIHDAGARAVIVLTNMIAAEDESDDIFNERMFNLLELTDDIPLGFYECPEPYKRLVTPEQLRLFVDTGRIIYHKDTCLDISQIRMKLKAVEGMDFGLYDAYMVHAVESLRAGSSGLSCIQGNYWPELIVWLCNNFNNNLLSAEVDAVQKFITDKMDVMHEVYPVTAKYYLKMRGLKITDFTRRDVGHFTENTARDMRQLNNDYEKLLSDLGLDSKTGF